MASDDLCDRGQRMFAEALTEELPTENAKRAELSLLFSDLVGACKGTELEAPLRHAHDDLHAQTRREREREVGPNLEQALKAVVG